MVKVHLIAHTFKCGTFTVQIESLVRDDFDRTDTEKAPAAIGPYVQAVADNGLLFISGQLGFDVEHGSVIPETVEEQATLSLKNLDAIMTAAGTDRTKVMKTTIFLTDMNDFAKVNEVYGAFFGESKPARSCVAVAALPKAAKVEIECIVSLK